MIRTYCDGCGIEFEPRFTYPSTRLRIKIDEMAPGQGQTTVHSCRNNVCIQEAVRKGMAAIPERR